MKVVTEKQVGLTEMGCQGGVCCFCRQGSCTDFWNGTTRPKRQGNSATLPPPCWGKEEGGGMRLEEHTMNYNFTICA